MVLDQCKIHNAWQEHSPSRFCLNVYLCFCTKYIPHTILIHKFLPILLEKLPYNREKKLLNELI